MTTLEYPTIFLTDVYFDPGYPTSGVDKQGNTWRQFEVDALAEQLPGECSICSETLDSSGWLCLDGGEEVCDSHIDYDEEDK